MNDATTTTDATTDPSWAIARRTQVFTCDEVAFAGLAERFVPDQDPALLDGLVLAAEHPTGWFVHAVRGPLDETEMGGFDDLVEVRVFLLLTEGPLHDTWSPASDGVHWVSTSVNPETALAS